MLELPPVLRRFASELEAADFKRVDERYDERAFGNGLIDVADDAGRSLRFVLDKGLWSIDVKLVASWMDVYSTALVLTGTPYERRALNNEEKVAYARQVLEAMPRSVPEQDRLLERVRSLRQRVWEEHYGTPNT
jgi:hypothetical protein